MYPTLKIETGISAGELNPLEVEIPKDLTWSNFVHIIETELRFDLEIDYKRTERTGSSLACHFSIRQRKKPTTKASGFLWWRKLTTEYVNDPDAPNPGMRVVGYFQECSDKRPSSLILGCAYNFCCDDIGSSVSFESDPKKLTPLVNSILTGIYKINKDWAPAVEKPRLPTPYVPKLGDVVTVVSVSPTTSREWIGSVGTIIQGSFGVASLHLRVDYSPKLLWVQKYIREGASSTERELTLTGFDLRLATTDERAAAELAMSVAKSKYPVDSEGRPIWVRLKNEKFWSRPFVRRVIRWDGPRPCVETTFQPDGTSDPVAVGEFEPCAEPPKTETTPSSVSTPYVPKVGDKMVYHQEDIVLVIVRVDGDTPFYRYADSRDVNRPEPIPSLNPKLLRYIGPATAAERKIAGLPVDEAMTPPAPASVEPRHTVGAVVKDSVQGEWIVVASSIVRYITSVNNGRIDMPSHWTFSRWATRAECEKHDVPFVDRTPPAATPAYPVDAAGRPLWVRITGPHGDTEPQATVGRIYRVLRWHTYEDGGPVIEANVGGTWNCYSATASDGNGARPTWEPCAAPTESAKEVPALEPRRTVGAVVEVPNSKCGPFAVVKPGTGHVQRELDCPGGWKLELATEHDTFKRWMTAEECKEHKIPFVERPMPVMPPTPATPAIKKGDPLKLLLMAVRETVDGSLDTDELRLALHQYEKDTSDEHRRS